MPEPWLPHDSSDSPSSSHSSSRSSR
jgi:hypothetical protein